MTSAPVTPGSTRSSRQEQMARYVLEQESATAAELAAMFDVSLMTVHRDLDELARRGLVRRYRGGVSAQPSSVFESSVEFRLRTARREKEAIARVAREMVEPGMAILLDDATTTLALARTLVGIDPLTVVTNFLAAVPVLRDNPGIRVIGLGGQYSHTHDCFVGVGCLEALSSLRVDLAFISTSAMTTDMTFHQEADIVLVKRAMLAAAARRVLLMDSSKIARRGLYRLAPVSDFDAVVLDSGVDPAVVEELRAGRTTVAVAPR